MKAAKKLFLAAAAAVIGAGAWAEARPVIDETVEAIEAGHQAKGWPVVDEAAAEASLEAVCNPVRAAEPLDGIDAAAERAAKVSERAMEAAEKAMRACWFVFDGAEISRAAFDEEAACEAAMDWTESLSEAEKRRLRDELGMKPEIWAYRRIKERHLESARRPKRDWKTAPAETASLTTDALKKALKKAKEWAEKLTRGERKYIEKRYGMTAEEFALLKFAASESYCAAQATRFERLKAGHGIEAE